MSPLPNRIWLLLLLSSCVAIAGNTSYLWSPPDSDFSVIFTGKPEIKQSETTVGNTRFTALTAEYLGDEGFERAEFAPRSPTGLMTKESALAIMTEYAKNYGMEHFDLSCDDSNKDDIVATLRASKTINTDKGSVIMNFYAVCHWSKKYVFTQTIGEAANTYPSPQGQAFLSSLKSTAP